MRIFLDCTNTLRTGTHTGIQRVVRNIAAQAVKQTGLPDVTCLPVAFRFGHFRRSKPSFRRSWKHRYRDLLLALRRKLHAWSKPYHGSPWFQRTVRVARPWVKTLLVDSLEWLALPVARVTMEQGDILVLLDASWNPPAGWWEGITRAKQSGVRVVPVVYDLIPVTHSRLMPWWVVGQFKGWLQHNLDVADGFLCISEATRAELTREISRRGRLPGVAEQIRTFPLGFTLDQSPAIAYLRAEVKALADRHTDRWPYLMVATFEPRKNHAFVLDAFEEVWKRDAAAELWLVGARGWETELLMQRLAAHPERGGRLRVFHDLSDVELDFAYRHAKATVAASTVEGYGLPVVEALARGCHVLASDIPVFREIAGDHAEYFRLDSLQPLIARVEALEAEGPAKRVMGFRTVDWAEAALRFLQQAIALAGAAERQKPTQGAAQTPGSLTEIQQRVAALEASLGLGAGMAPPIVVPAVAPAPLVSVILPVRNRPALVLDAIRSVQRQSFPRWELIVVDDGSTDGTAAAVENTLLDPRIRLLRQEHGGQGAARNRGLAAAKGGLVAYVDSDNLWFPDYLATAVAAFQADPNLACTYGMLVSDEHQWVGVGVVFQPFDRQSLLDGTLCIDLNVFMHRRELYERLGGFDTELTRVEDWDLVLRYTEGSPPLRLEVPAARYRRMDRQSVTETNPYGPDRFKIRRKWLRPSSGHRPLRVLYVLENYPQLSEMYIETEIQCMTRWGVHVEAWSERDPASPCDASVPVHRGTLAEAFRRVQPDVLHVHWLGYATAHAAELAGFGVPVTVRAHGFDTDETEMAKTLGHAFINKIFCFPHQTGRFAVESRIVPVVVPFNTAMFAPQREKDRRMVVRASSAQPDKNLELFIDVAARLPEFHFTLALVTVTTHEAYLESLCDRWRAAKPNGQLLLNVPRGELLPLVNRAGICLHSCQPPDRLPGVPLGMPISLAESMATGSYVLTAEMQPLIDYVGPAGAAYRNAAHAVELIRATTKWSDAQWHQAWTRSVDQAFVFHADETALRPIYDTWCELVAEARVPVPVPALASD